jgi:hypothetical protein
MKIEEKIDLILNESDKPKNCPKCKNWRFDRTKKYCDKGHKLTYSTSDVLHYGKNIGTCKDFE